MLNAGALLGAAKGAAGSGELAGELIGKQDGAGFGEATAVNRDLAAWIPFVGTQMAAVQRRQFPSGNTPQPDVEWYLRSLRVGRQRPREFEKCLLKHVGRIQPA